MKSIFLLCLCLSANLFAADKTAVSSKSGVQYGKNSSAGAYASIKQYLDLLGQQPHIPLADLRKISAPTLVMAADKDVIRAEHTLQIFENISNAHLCIFPGATHFIPAQEPAQFNQTVEKFFSQPYRRPDTKELLD